MKSILLIDDAKTIVAALKEFLSRHDYQVVAPMSFVEINELTADHFAEVSQLLKEHSPSVVILDLSIPALSGEQIAYFLKRYYDGPIVIFSGRPEAERSEAAKRLGAFDHVSKEASLEELLSAVDAAVRVREV
jgi:two-component system response regulator EvgA